MRVSLAWLREFVEAELEASDAARRLLRRGFEVTSVKRAGGPVEGVVAARVEEAAKHPNADKLKLCRVFDGSARLEVVCGAPNVEPGGVYPFARLGARLPGGLVIEKRAIRGRESQGMLCSARELGLGEDASGLYRLPEDVPLGRDVTGILALDDFILDVEVTPNRPDALSHWGLARELAADLGLPLRLPAAEISEGAPDPALVRVDDPACDFYLARVLEGVRPAPAPLIARLRLERCGVRSINGVVDATNYVLLELGHPLHAFDRARLAGGSVAVRRGRPGERLVGLDGVDRPVEGALLIADARGPAALAGVMGGRESAVTEATTSLLLESARFAASEIRRAARRLGLSTESSFRFERGTDVQMAALAASRAAHLILAWCGGRLVSIHAIGGGRPGPAPVAVPVRRLGELLGAPVSGEEAARALERLGFACELSADRLTARPPAHRADIRETADVAEEVLRQIGLERVPARVRGAGRAWSPEAGPRRLARQARDRFVAMGFLEARTSGLIPRSILERTLGPGAEPPVELENPLSASGECLNPSLLPALLAAAEVNLRRGNAHPRFIECARVFRRAPGGVAEADHAAFVAVGNDRPDHWRWKPRLLEMADAQAWVDALLADWRVAGLAWRAGDAAWVHPAESRSLWLGEARLGVVGRLHPGTAQAWGLSAPVFVGEFDLTAAAGGARTPRRFRGLSRQPALVRDFSLVFPPEVSWVQVADWIRREGPGVEAVELFDVFTGGSLPPGHRSLAFRVRFRLPDRTLTEAEAQDGQDRILRGLAAALGGRPRTATP